MLCEYPAVNDLVRQNKAV